MIPLLIFCLQEHVSDVIRQIERHAANGWQESGDIAVHAFDDTTSTGNNRRRTTEEARQLLLRYDSQAVMHVLLIRGPQITIGDLPKNPFLFPKEITKKEFLDAKSPLASLIAATGWGWLARTKEIVQQWHHGPVDVDGWIKQFEVLGESWLAEYLLKNLRFITEAKLGEAIIKNIPSVPGSRLRFGIFSNEIGKSGGVVSILIRKHYKDAALAEVAQCIEERNAGETLILVEDGLYSATEIVAVLDSLLGERQPGRKQKTRAIVDKSLLNIPFFIVFGVTVDYGVEVVRHFLARKNERLTAQLLSDGNADTHLQVLTDPDVTGGIMELAAFRRHLAGKVEPWIFSEACTWHGKQQRARQICSDIGSELWDAYVTQQVNSSGWDKQAWSQERIRLCSLGMDGLGLTVILAHSIPKASLPVFWMGGNIRYGKKTLSWKPLFPNA